MNQTVSTLKPRMRKGGPMSRPALSCRCVRVGGDSYGVGNTARFVPYFVLMMPMRSFVIKI
jgi:hypothetical protein